MPQLLTLSFSMSYQIGVMIGLSFSFYLGINEVTFNDSHSSAHFTNSTPLSTINNLTAQFRTRQNNTVIFSSVHNATFFEITVQDGRIMVGYNLSENMSGVVDTGNKVALKC